MNVYDVIISEFSGSSFQIWTNCLSLKDPIAVQIVLGIVDKCIYYGNEDDQFLSLCNVHGGEPCKTVNIGGG